MSEAVVAPEPGFELMFEHETFIDFIGPVWRRFDEGSATLLLRVDKQHTNPNGTAHGGVLMSVMDVTLGSGVEAALRGTPQPRHGHPVTMQLSCSMIGAAFQGEWLRAEATVDRVARSVAFVSGRMTTTDGRVVMTATGVFKNPSSSTLSRQEQAPSG